MASSEADVGNYVRCHKALQFVCHHAASVVDNFLQAWHCNKKQTLPSCVRPRPRPPNNPQECSDRGKPKPSSSCQNCVDWGTAVKAEYYPQSAKGNIPWGNVNPACLCRSYREVAKAFELHLQQKQILSKAADFNSASLFKFMMHFGGFHRNDNTKYEVIKKVWDICNTLSHMKLVDNLHLSDQQVNTYLRDIGDLVTCLETLHPQHFAKKDADDVRSRLDEYHQKMSQERSIQDDSKSTKKKDTEAIQAATPAGEDYAAGSRTAMDKATDSDFGDVIELLGPDELQQLYYKLNLPPHDVDKALESTGSHNVDLRARKVLQLWRTRHGQTATRQALLEALEKCRNKDAVNALQTKWNCKDPCFDLEHCQKDLITSYKQRMGQVQLLPWFEEETRKMDDIYVSLELEKAVKGERHVIHLEKNEDLVNLQTSENTPATRVIVKGLAGSGKSTLMAKLAYLWAQQNCDCPLGKFELVFILTLRELLRGSSLIDAIFQQILAEDSVSQVGLKKYIQSHPDKVLLLLDGFDEYSAPDLDDMQGNVEKTIAYQICRKMCVIVTTRHHKQLGKCQSFYECVQLTGFSPVNVQLYMNKFFHYDTKLVEGLSRKLTESDILNSLSHIPVMLMLMCLLWEDEQTLPNTQSELYAEFTSFLWKKSCERDNDSSEQSSLDDFLIKLGKLALDGLMSEKTLSEEKLLFVAKDFGLEFEKGCQLGILTMERLRSKLRVTNAVSFLHKSFQEYCAAHYWASLFDSAFDQFGEILCRIDTQDVVLSKFEVLKFCCALCRNNPGAVKIIQHVISLWLRDRCLCSTIGEIGVGEGLPVLILLYESSFPEDANLIKSLESFTSSDKITIENRIPQTVPMFHDFIKSYDILSHIKSIRFENHPLDSLHVICDALALMPGVEKIHISGSLMTVANPDSVKQLGVSVSELSQLVSLRVIGAIGGPDTFDVSPVLERMCKPKSSKIMRSIKFFNVNLDGNFLSQVLSNQPHLHKLTLDCIKLKGCIKSVLKAIKAPLTNLNLNGTHVGNAVGHMQHIMPHLQELSLKNTGLEPEHIRTLCEFIPKEANLSEHMPHLQELSLVNTGLKPKHIHLLRKFIADGENLSELNLSSNDIGIAGMSLADSLKSCYWLSSLNLENANLTDECIIGLAQNFCDLPNIETLWLKGNHIGKKGLHEFFLHLHHLTELRAFAITATVDGQCTALVRDCLVDIGKNVQGEIIIDADDVDISSIKIAAYEYTVHG